MHILKIHENTSIKVIFMFVDKLSEKNFKKIIKETLYLLFGTFLMACSTVFFLLPNKLSTGGFSGIATIAYYFFNIPVGTAMIFLNIPLFILAFYKIGKQFIFKSIIGTFLLAIFIDLLDKFDAITTDSFLACIYGGILMGIGTSLVLKGNGSTGGSDLLSYIIRSFNNKLKNGELIIIIDTIIIILNILFFKEIEIALYSTIAIYLMGKMIDIIFEGVDFTKVLFIISDKSDEIADKIGKEVQRGSTGIYAKGMHTNKDKIVLFCVGNRREIISIKNIALDIDHKAFIVIFNSREVLGKGFEK